MGEAIISNINEIIKNILNSCDDIISKIANNTLDLNNIIILIDRIEILSNAIIQFEDATDNVNELNEVLKNLVNSLEDNDLYLFSDLVEYELKPLLENWLVTIN